MPCLYQGPGEILFIYLVVNFNVKVAYTKLLIEVSVEMAKFRNKYRVRSARLQNWDYRWAGAYFITICTQNRTPYFGEIMQQQMQLSHVGVIADVLWYQLPHHTQNIELGPFVVMPNHVHGIVIINENVGFDAREMNNKVGKDHPQVKISTDQPQTLGQQRFQNIGKNSLSSIVGSYKSAVTKHAKRLGLEFQWQPRFHDHIIRNDSSYQRIAEYIQTNPSHWKEDRFFLE